MVLESNSRSDILYHQMRYMGKNSLFEKLYARAQSCVLCASMRNRKAVLGEANGLPGARVLFIAEAPGRFGADRTGTPLHGDRSGDHFESLLDAAGLRRNRCFITNAVLCNPRDGVGRNRKPTMAEVRNCSAFLKEQIELINAGLIVTLGVTALDAMKLIEHHDLELARNVGRPVAWFGRTLVPLYHPSFRALRRRSARQQREDFRRLAALLVEVS